MDEKDGLSDRENRGCSGHRNLAPCSNLNPSRQACSIFAQSSPNHLAGNQILHIKEENFDSFGQRSFISDKCFLVPCRYRWSVTFQTLQRILLSLSLPFPASSLTTLPSLNAFCVQLSFGSLRLPSSHGVYFERSMYTIAIISTSRAHPRDNLLAESHKPSRTASHSHTLHKHHLQSRRTAKPPGVGGNKLLIFLATFALRLLHMPKASTNAQFLRWFKDWREKRWREIYAKTVLSGLRRREESVPKRGFRPYRWSI
ncbi:hypothetical protein BDR22DRAFT_689573 [Usnea florida]